jgi:hypothetical protein
MGRALLKKEAFFIKFIKFVTKKKIYNNYHSNDSQPRLNDKAELERDEGKGVR